MIQFISIQEAAKLLGYVDSRPAKDYCYTHGIKIFSEKGRKQRFILKAELIKCIELEPLNYLMSKYGVENLPDVYQAYANLNLLSIAGLEQRRKLNFEGNNLPIVTQHKEGLDQLPLNFARGIMPTMQKEPLYFPPEKRVRGLNIVVFCYLCETNCYETCGETNGPIQECPFGNRHALKLYIKRPDGKIITRVLNTRDVSEAIRQAQEIKKELEGGAKEEQKEVSINKQIKREEVTQPPLFIDVLDTFYKWMDGSEVKSQYKKERSKGYLKELKRSINLLRESLLQAGNDLNKLRMNQVNDDTVGIVFNTLEEKGFKNRTFNKYLTVYTAIINFYKQEYDPLFKNHFEKVPHKRVIHNPQAISREEYEKLLSVIKPENGIEIYSTGETRNHFKAHTKDSICIAAETGLRREGIFSIKYSDVDYANQFIKVPNHKVNTIQRRTGDEELFIYVPLTESLRSLIEKIKEKNKSVDGDYIIAPDHISSARITTLSNDLSRAFAHFYKQTNPTRKLSFKSIRKRYISEVNLLMGLQTYAITGHKEGSKVLSENYIDKALVAKAASRLHLFSEDRQNELEQTRNKTINQTPTIEK